MKLSFEKNELLKTINISLKAVASKTTMPILSCILIDAEGDGITFISNNMELAIETAAEGKILEAGKIALDARMLSEMIRKFPDGDVIIESNDTWETKIFCENARFTIFGKNPAEFSEIPKVESDHSVKVSQFYLKNMIHQTIFSISQMETNRMLTGELLSIMDRELKLIAMDGHRVAVRTMELEQPSSERRIIIPGKTMLELSRILSDRIEDEVEILMTDNHVVFTFNETKVVSRLIEGEYFRIEQIMNGDYDTKLEVNRQQLLSALDRSMLLVSESDKKPIIFDTNEQNLQLRILSNRGSMSENVEIAREGADIKIAFNPKFMIDALRVIEDETVTLYMLNPQSPCNIKDETGSYSYLIVPVSFIEEDSSRSA